MRIFYKLSYGFGPITVMPHHNLEYVGKTLIIQSRKNSEIKPLAATAFVVTIGKRITFVWQRGLRDVKRS